MENYVILKYIYTFLEKNKAMQIKYILFDLDGTITESALGIANSVAYSLEKFQINVENKAELKKFVGPPLHGSYEKFYGFSSEKADLAVKYYREYYTVKGMFENEIYEGVPEMLSELKALGKTLIIATSKPEIYAKKILEYFNLDVYFDYICGATFDSSRTDKSLVIKYALETAGINDKSEVIMIGDREHDIIGAKDNGLKSIGVLYGYGDFDELNNAGSDYIVKNAKEIINICK